MGKQKGQQKASKEGQQKSSKKEQPKASKKQQKNEKSVPLKTDRGQTSIRESVVAKLSGFAAREIEGVSMGDGASQAGDLASSLTGGGNGGPSRGVTVEVGEEEAAVDLTMTTEYGKSIPQISEAVRRNVIDRVEKQTGLSVTEVTLTVTNVFVPQEEPG